jgi:hypothetical protein
MHTTSDHQTIVTSANLHLPRQQKEEHFHLKTMDTKIFQNILNVSMIEIEQVTAELVAAQENKQEKLEKLAEAITVTVTNALEALTKKTSGKGTGQ